MNTATTTNNDFMKYRAPTNATTNGNHNSSVYPSYNSIEIDQPTSWLHGNDFNSLTEDLFPTGNGNDFSYGNLSGINLNLDQIKIVKL